MSTPDHVKQLEAAETELSAWVNRWQEESDLIPVDLVGLLECMKLQLYTSMVNLEKEDE